MKKTYWRLLCYARPLYKYAIPYFLFTLIHAFFNLFNYLMVIPVIEVLLSGEGMVAEVVSKPEFRLNTTYIKEMLNYTILHNFGTNYNTMHILLFVALLLVCVSLISNFFRYLAQRTMEMVKINSMQNLRDEVFDNVVHLNVGYFSNERKGDVISKLTSDIQVIQYCLQSTFQVIFRDPLLVLTFLAGMLIISWQLTIFSVLFLPVVAFFIAKLVKKLRREARAAQEKYADIVSTIDETVSGVKIIKAYNAEEYVNGRFASINGLYSRIMRSMARRQQLASPTSEFLTVSALAVLLLFGGKLVIGGSLLVSEFIAYLAIFSQITRPLRSMTDAFSTINQGIAAGERVLGLLDTPTAIKEKPDAKVLDCFNDKIEFCDIHFSYEEKEIIKGISMSIRRGENIALVGMSGGGKSTLSELILRFYDVQQGAILIDGTDVKDLTLRSLRANVGLVSQDTVLFNDTIGANIRMGKRDATEEEIIAAARIANAHDFIMATECGYQTNIGDRGMKLSGGQRQRLSIARAVLKNPEILILDEATSSLDTESEKLVQDALDTLLKGRTSVVIAHRLSTIVNADRIYVIDEGKIVEEGNHEELISQGGIYSKLVKMQHMA